MNVPSTLLFNRSDVQAMLSAGDCFRAVEESFRQLADGRAKTPGVLAIRGPLGGFHIKAGAMKLSRNYFAAKINGNFDRNLDLGLPRVQGIIVLADADNGAPLAVFDSMEITRLRTAAATAVAAKYLALSHATRATIVGCGAQADAQLRALLEVRPLKQIFVFDAAVERARRFAEETAKALGLEVVAAPDLAAAARASEICVTLTPSRTPILFRDSLSPGTFVAGVGADAEDKNELDAELLRASKLVTDVREQCVRIGDLHHAITRGVLRAEDVHADLGEIVAGKKPGRTSDEEVIVFDSTGMALQDVAAAAIVYEKAQTQTSANARAFSFSA